MVRMVAPALSRIVMVTGCFVLDDSENVISAWPLRASRYPRCGRYSVTALAVGDVTPCSSGVMSFKMKTPRPYVETTTSCHCLGTAIHVTGAEGSPSENCFQCAPSSSE